jgi:hypothetical protein
MSKAMNIYQMYVANGNKAGFWVKRNSWSWQTAKIVTIGGKSEGELSGNPPYYSNQKVYGLFNGHGKQVELTSPGTYGYTLITTEE